MPDIHERTPHRPGWSNWPTLEDRQTERAAGRIHDSVMLWEGDFGTWLHQCSNLFPWLESLLCTFAVTGWQTVQLERAVLTIRLWQASVALYLTVVVWRMVKKGEVEIPIQFHTSTPCKLPAQHRTAAALLPLCCCCLLRLKTVLMRGRGKLWSP